eukprot:SAG22_NODE_74_length_22289_cov_65.265119_3_plen_174_part_00
MLPLSFCLRQCLSVRSRTTQEYILGSGKCTISPAAAAAAGGGGDSGAEQVQLPAGLDTLLRVMRQKEHCEFRLSPGLSTPVLPAAVAAAEEGEKGSAAAERGGAGLIGEIRLFETVSMTDVTRDGGCLMKTIGANEWPRPALPACLPACLHSRTPSRSFARSLACSPLRLFLR